MKQILSFAVLAIAHAVRAPVVQSEDVTDELCQDLLKHAEQWSMPQPKPGSTLLKIWVHGSDSNGKYVLGFVEPGRNDQALVGFDFWQTKSRVETQKVVDQASLSLSDISPTDDFAGPFGVNYGLLTGIQLLRHGNEKLGIALIKKSLSTSAGHHFSRFKISAGQPAILMLARSCLAATLNDIATPKPDFAKLKRRIDRLIADQPELESEATASVLKSLDESVTHQLAPDGTIERLVDQFLMSGTEEVDLRSETIELFPPGKRELVLKGFAAVPALIAQRHSNRMTNHVKQGFNNFPSYLMTAGQVIDEYLVRLANDEFDSDWLGRRKGYPPADEAVLEWWRGASAMGEPAYVEKHICHHTAGEIPISLSYELLLIAGDRYQSLLPSIYRKLLQSSVPSWPVVDQILETKAISRTTKIELFKEGATTNSKAHRDSAVAALRKLNDSGSK